MPSPFAQNIAAPHSSDAERTVLGALFLDSDAIYQITDKLTRSDFFDPVHGEIYAAIQKLAECGSGVDFVTVTASLAESTRFRNAGGSAYLAEITAEVPTASHIEHYVKIVADHSQNRRLMALGEKLKVIGSDAEMSAEDALEAAERGFLELSGSHSGSDPIPIGELRHERFQRYSALYEADDTADLRGIPSGFQAIDRKLTGFAPGQLIILAARPSMGKTALALDFAKYAACEKEKSVAVFSLEMSAEEIFDRLVAKDLNIPAWQLEQGKFDEATLSRMGDVMDRIGTYPITIDDRANTVFEISSRARRQKMRFGLDLVIIDYLQLVSVEELWARENQTQRMSHISRRLKQLARELDLPVIALSQLNRDVEKRAGNRPMLSDLRDSGSIEQDADRILMLYREDYYDEDSDRPGLTDVYIRKNRQGPTGSVELLFENETMRFVTPHDP